MGKKKKQKAKVKALPKLVKISDDTYEEIGSNLVGIPDETEMDDEYVREPNRPIDHVEDGTVNGYRYTWRTSENHPGFDILDTKKFDYRGEIIGSEIWIEILDEELKQFLGDVSRSGSYYQLVPFRVSLKVPSAELKQFEKGIETYKMLAAENSHYVLQDDHPIYGFIQFLNARIKARIDAYERMLAANDILYDNLDLYFTEGDPIVWGHGDNIEGGIIQETTFRETFAGPLFDVQVLRYNSNGQHFGKSSETVGIGGFYGKAQLDELFLRKPTQAEMTMMTARGKMWAKMVHTPQYLQFEGKMLIPSWFGDIPIRATGRCMIDLHQHRQNYEGYDRTFDGLDVDEKNGDQMPPKFFFTTPNVGYGFSLKNKKWGKFPIAQLSQINFRDDAYDLLVMDPEIKSEVKALVEQSDDMFTDVISDKGGGAIFLLHGPPGLGKTLTAESVAEKMHRPLYSVSIGELGISPGEVEQSLRDILELVTSWNAVLLLDEADIFLEARTKDDIIRNAMVGVFLRLLEYHNGVLFLTTNRVQNFDVAFMSRISVIIKYDEFTEQTRKTVWDNILFAAGLSDAGIDTEYMAVQYQINGRQIKNAIRIAMSLAKSDGVTCTQAYIERVVARNIAVIQEIADTGGDPPMTLLESVDSKSSAA